MRGDIALNDFYENTRYVRHSKKVHADRFLYCSNEHVYLSQLNINLVTRVIHVPTLLFAASF